MFGNPKSFLTRLGAAAVVVLALQLPAVATDIERVTSPSGIEAWLVSDDTLPLISMSFAFVGGSAQDPADRPGVANMLSALLDEGAGDLDSAAFQAELDQYSVELRFNAGRDAFSGSLKTLSAERDDAFRLLRLALTEPRLDAEPIDRIRAQIIAGIRRDERDPETIAGETWRRLAFSGHPYAQPVDGTVDTVAAITRDDLVGYLDRNLARDNLKIAVVGDIDAATLAARLDEIFGALPEKAELTPVAEIVPATGRRENIEMSIPQTVIQFGLPGLKRDDPDFIPAYVANHILGGGSFTSRLYEEVREKRGLAYSAWSGLAPQDHAGFLVGGTATRADRAAEALAVIEAEIKRFAEEGPTDQEVEDAKRYLIGSYPLRFTSSGQISSQLLGIQLDRLGIDYIDKRNDMIAAVTAADVRRVAQSLLAGKELTVVKVGQPDA